jgi:tRNA(Ile2) C34 agmatinyltransferase TiaS
VSPAAAALAPGTAGRGVGEHAADPALEERLAEVLAHTRAHEEAECPVCGGPMAGEGEAARCLGCGSILS